MVQWQEQMKEVNRAVKLVSNRPGGNPIIKIFFLSLPYMTDCSNQHSPSVITGGWGVEYMCRRANESHYPNTLQEFHSSYVLIGDVQWVYEFGDKQLCFIKWWLKLLPLLWKNPKPSILQVKILQLKPGLYLMSSSNKYLH